MEEIKSIRETFLPDENCIFSRCDLQQAEHRMGLVYCGSSRMMETVNLNSEEWDEFTEGGKKIFGEDEFNSDRKKMRYLTKKIYHASWRDMAGDKMSESISKDTDGALFIPANQCQKLINTYLEQNPEIKEIYMPWVRQQIMDVGVLVNSWGRRWDVRWRRIDADLYRAAYSFYLQSEVADWVNQYGFIPGTHYMLSKYGKPLNAHVHDEVIASVLKEDAFDYSWFIVNSLQQRREIPKGSGRILCIPAGITVGNSWGDKRIEFKRLPGRDEFYKKLEEGGF